MNLKFHNPVKLAPSDIGEGYRLLLVTETRVDATHYWAKDDRWHKMPYNIDPKDLALYDSITYRTDKPLPIPEGPKIENNTVVGTPDGWRGIIVHDVIHKTAGEPVVVPVDGGKGGHMVYEGDKTMYVPAPPDTQDKADAVLNERAQSYGKFIDNARIARSLKAVVAGALLDRQDTIPDDMAEALDVILSKIARIVSGTEKGWHDQLLDIEGYARLVRERIEGNPR